jgi:hypothetical protein
MLTKFNLIQNLGARDHLQPDTISGYVTGMKNALLGQGHNMSDALGEPGRESADVMTSSVRAAMASESRKRRLIAVRRVRPSALASSTTTPRARLRD